jgi:hypothetical protein
MTYEAESGQRRWLLKALRESSGELFGLFRGLSERELRWRPAEHEWSLKEVAAHMRDAELLYRRQIEAIASEHEPRLPYESIDVLPSEREYQDEPLLNLLEEFGEAREETFWILRTLGESEWQRTGDHPYRGRTSISDIARELHEHDLEHLYEARRLRESLREREAVPAT